MIQMHYKVLKKPFLGFVENQAPYEIVDYASQMGIIRVPLEDDAGLINVKKAMVSLSYLSIELFFDHFLAHCTIDSIEMFCLYQDDDLIEIDGLTETLEILKNLKIDANYKISIAKDFISFLDMKASFLARLKKFGVFSLAENSSFPAVIMPIGELSKIFPSKHLDWLEMINNQLPIDSQKTLDDQILIHNPRLFTGMYSFFVHAEERQVVNLREPFSCHGSRQQKKKICRNLFL